MSISYNSKKKLLLYTHSLHWEIDKCIHKSQAITFRPDHPKNGLTHLLTSIEFNETSSTSLNGQLLVLQNLLLKVKSFPSYYHHLGLHLMNPPFKYTKSCFVAQKLGVSLWNSGSVVGCRLLSTRFSLWLAAIRQQSFRTVNYYIHTERAVPSSCSDKYNQK